jgi:hypothetical protein
MSAPSPAGNRRKGIAEAYRIAGHFPDIRKVRNHQQEMEGQPKKIGTKKRIRPSPIKVRQKYDH